jgi:hypothetical protein
MVVPNGGSIGGATSRILDPTSDASFSALGRTFVKPLVHASEACLSSGLNGELGRQGLGLTASHGPTEPSSQEIHESTTFLLHCGFGLSSRCQYILVREATLRNNSKKAHF